MARLNEETTMLFLKPHFDKMVNPLQPFSKYGDIDRV